MINSYQNSKISMSPRSSEYTLNPGTKRPRIRNYDIVTIGDNGDGGGHKAHSVTEHELAQDVIEQSNSKIHETRASESVEIEAQLSDRALRRHANVGNIKTTTHLLGLVNTATSRILDLFRELTREHNYNEHELETIVRDLKNNAKNGQGDDINIRNMLVNPMEHPTENMVSEFKNVQATATMPQADTQDVRVAGPQATSRKRTLYDIYEVSELSVPYKLNEFVEVFQTSYDGKGVRAVRNIPSGTLLLQENPLIENIKPDRNIKKYRRTLQRYMEQFRRKEKIAFIRLSCQPQKDTKEDGLISRMQMNAFSLDSTGQTIFPRISSFNHSCRPNCLFTPDIYNVASIRALVDIREGDELTIDYSPDDIEALKPVEERKAFIESRWGFHCACDACKDQPTTDENRNELNRLTRLLGLGKPRRSATLKSVDEHIENYIQRLEKERRFEAVIDARQKAIAVYKGTFANHIISRKHHKSALIESVRIVYGRWSKEYKNAINDREVDNVTDYSIPAGDEEFPSLEQLDGEVSPPPAKRQRRSRRLADQVGAGSSTSVQLPSRQIQSTEILNTSQNEQQPVHIQSPSNGVERTVVKLYIGGGKTKEGLEATA
jgi:hypothetical protein